ncbi:hypothetical protein CROQUDRAFT_665620 [Cronartium quercuum f. sp. fusiforme G11]|uniref:Uncharacterized protein n=1 Tax=Cronartium quercuum f. sp. fusiforme G11 TaxID=708437 RepID=A0A9P6NAC7_9BASI|nr:hypothetical protein CROQUDRAFT_665620 [Cronartium quercuum f. sp. fusiforme G11]
MLFVIILSSILFFFVIVLAVVFLSFRSKPRHHDSSRSRPSTTASSSRSRMAARWAHMEQGASIKPPDGVKSSDEVYDDIEEVVRTNPVPVDDDAGDFPDEFGTGGGIANSHSRRASLPSSTAGSALVGSGPNGTRTFLKGWFGLDEPSHSGFNVSPEVREKDRSDTLPMRTPGRYPGSSVAGSESVRSPIPHHLVPTTEDTDADWETASIGHEELA